MYFGVIYSNMLIIFPDWIVLSLSIWRLFIGSCIPLTYLHPLLFDQSFWHYKMLEAYLILVLESVVSPRNADFFDWTMPSEQCQMCISIFMVRNIDANLYLPHLYYFKIYFVFQL